MTRRILPPNPADVLRSHHERLERLERLLQQPPEPDPLPPAGGEGGSCTHIWGGEAWIENWTQSFGAWRGAGGIEVDIPSAGQVHVTATLYMDAGQFDYYSLAPWQPDWGEQGMSLGPVVHGVPGRPVTLTWVDYFPAGPAQLGFVVRLGPNSVPDPWAILPVSAIWSECGHGTNVTTPPI